MFGNKNDSEDKPKVVKPCVLAIFPSKDSAYARELLDNGTFVQYRLGNRKRTEQVYALAGSTAEIFTSGTLDKRITATRLALTGPFALAMKKSKDNR